MSAFLVNAACNGRPPMHLNALQHYPRPPLIARLLRERHVARFIVAPEGYGKTALALEYAETVFSFDQVYWLEGKSPCFLRDLDRRIVASTLLENPESFLVVMEDVPLLDGSRAELLSSMIDEFLDRGCEVLATCVPICDVYAKLQRDRVRLTAVDLLWPMMRSMRSDRSTNAKLNLCRRCFRPTALPVCTGGMAATRQLSSKA